LPEEGNQPDQLSRSNVLGKQHGEMPLENPRFATFPNFGRTLSVFWRRGWCSLSWQRPRDTRSPLRFVNEHILSLRKSPDVRRSCTSGQTSARPRTHPVAAPQCTAKPRICPSFGLRVRVSRTRRPSRLTAATAGELRESGPDVPPRRTSGLFRKLKTRPLTKRRGDRASRGLLPGRRAPPSAAKHRQSPAEIGKRRKSWIFRCQVFGRLSEHAVRHKNPAPS
jgi:hypothetical protein